ncbi:AMP-binding protein [Paraburkholderia sp. USG1]|uniref:AMP-binding protein n=1 Tax=Paraburkholderia sp. USG1 TaxID=2952268 RepID=UPI0028635E80|nr:AMP-binding protein [Paraburkholderia sp. USG1]MDR8394712.1 AMP-binding protein [Paraburkholderia sp. USG1]
MSITQGLQRSVQSTPDAVATRCAGRVRTFAEQADRVGRLAAGLRGLGLERGGRAAIISRNSDRFLEFLLAASWSGAVFNPLNLRWNADELAPALIESGSRIVAVDDAALPLVKHLRASCPDMCVLYCGEGATPAGTIGFEELIASSTPMDDVHCDGGDLAGLFYTGGTTGRPKGVMLSHANLVTAALGPAATGPLLTEGGTVLHVAPLFHLAGIWPWLLQMLIGGQHSVVESFKPETTSAIIAAEAITDVLLVPTMIQMLVGHLEESGLRLPSLRNLLYAGSPIPEALLDRVEQVLPGVALTQIYGMTELAPVATILRPADHVGMRRRTAGKAAPHTLVKIVDLDDHEQPRGEPGEIVARGAQVMLGYWNQPELSRAVLRGGWMHTGDVGVMDGDGFVQVIDRLKDMIITGGENVYSVEVENAIAAHPSVAACAVIGVPDPEWGERVHAVVVVVPGASLTTEDLRNHVTARIARYKAPRSLEIVDALPISAAGKILKSQLRRQAHVSNTE